MSTIRKTITVTDQQEEWIKAQVASGGFTNDSEYIRDLLRRDQAQLSGVQEIRQALLAAEKSGFTDKSPDDIRKAVQDRMRKNDQL